MSDDGAWSIAPPPFDAAAALQTMRRFARDQRSLVERGEGWLLGADLVLKLAVDGATLQVQLVRRPSRAPEWDSFTLKAPTDLRRVQEEVRRRLVRWQDDD